MTETTLPFTIDKGIMPQTEQIWPPSPRFPFGSYLSHNGCAISTRHASQHQMVKPKVKPLVSAPTVEHLIAQTTAHATAGRYKELIDTCKELIKRNVPGDWQSTLESAYGHRAEELAAKGMYREAVAMWESSGGAVNNPNTTPTVVGWMLAATQYAQAAALIGKIPTLPEPLQIRIGAALLMGHDELAAGLPEDAPLRRHLPLARGALDAWCRSDDDAVRECLRLIPFRSPYRELRQVLQGQRVGDPEMLRSVPSTSPYVGLARAALAARAPLPELSQRFAALQPTEQALVACLLGIAEAQLQTVLEVYATIANPANTKTALPTLFKWLASHTNPLPKEEARRIALAILPHQPELTKPFRNRFGALTPLEKARLNALIAEQEDDFEQAATHWTVVYDTYDQKDATGALMAATVLRHQAKIRTYTHQENDPATIQWLNRSLELDPLDRNTWLKLINLQRKALPSIKHPLLKQALATFGEDPELLRIATEEAIADNSFQAACNYATTLLRLDPINHEVHSLLLIARLRQFCATLRIKKYTLAARELEDTRQLATTSVWWQYTRRSLPAF